MAEEQGVNVRDVQPEAVFEEAYDHTRFLSASCQRNYDRLLSKPVVRERGINMEKVEEKMPDFYRRLIESGWICFAAEPVEANHTIVTEFYANASMTDFNGALATTVRGVTVSFNSELINAFYGLPDVDNEAHKARARELGTQWFVETLHAGREPRWVQVHKGVESHEFTAEAKTWLAIVCARVIPTTHDTDVTPDRARVIAAIIDGLPVNVGEYILIQIQETAIGLSPRSIPFPSLVTSICYAAGVPRRPNDDIHRAAKPIHPLLKRGPPDASKKRKMIDVTAPSFGQPSGSGTDATATSTAAAGSSDPPGPLHAGPYSFRHISSQIHVVDTQIRQHVAGLPTGPVEAPHSEAGPASEVPTLAAVSTRVEDVSRRLATMERRQKQFREQFREHERKKGKLLSKMWSTLKLMCMTPSEDDDDEPEGDLLFPSSEEE